MKIFQLVTSAATLTTSTLGQRYDTMGDCLALGRVYGTNEGKFV